LKICFVIYFYFNRKHGLETLNCAAINPVNETRNRNLSTECFQYRVRVLSLNRVSLRSSCLKGHAGFAFTNAKGRCARDGTEGERPMQGMRVGRPTERKRYETAVLVLWRQVLVYRPIQTRRLTPCRSYAPFLSRGAHSAVKSNELPPVCHNLLLNKLILDLDLFERNSAFSFIMVIMVYELHYILPNCCKCGNRD